MQTMTEEVPQTTRSRWLSRWREQPEATITLFCFPYAGGSSSTYRLWQGLLPEWIDVAPVQLPGRGERLSEPPFHRMSEMVEVLGRELTPYFHKPFAFFGHSMGALIAFELTRWLRRNKQTLPAHLFVSGRRAPQIPEAIEPSWHLPEEQFIERVRQLNGTPQEVLQHPELMQLLIPLLRADFAVCETYEYHAEPPVECALTVFGGDEDAEAPREYLTPWREHTSAKFKLHMLRGDHFFVQTAHVESVRIIAEELESVGSGKYSER
jgi:medium-chain acyl-[acyl-carrier-protein] hydrolase